MMPDGTRYRVVNGLVRSIADRNGNRLEFLYDGYGRVSQINDSLDRVVTVQYDYQDPQFGKCDRIVYKGFANQERIIRVARQMTGGGGAFELGGVVNALSSLTIWLPDGVRRYACYFNSYGEIRRIELPTGGAVEYDHAAGVTGTYASGQVGDSEYMLNSAPWQEPGSSPPFLPKIFVYRRLVERRLYTSSGAGASYVSRTTYSRPESASCTMQYGIISVCTFADEGYVRQETYANGSSTPLASSRHYFHGRPAYDMYGSLHQFQTYPGTEPTGRERLTEVLDGQTVVRSVSNTWAYRQRGSILTESVTALADANLVSKRTFAYDDYLNTADIFEYDYGQGAPGGLLRRFHTDYKQDAAYVNALSGAHLRSLPTQKWVSSDAAGADKLALTAYAYDEFGLADRPSLTGHDAAYTVSYTTRGNLTSVVRFTNPASGSGPVTATSHYDTAGNVVSSTDPKGNTSYIGYADSFSDGVARNTYALPTSRTSPPPDPNNTGHGSAAGLTTSTVYDFSTGAVVSTTDANSKVTTAEYNPNDELDRLKAVVRPDGGRTDYDYGDDVGNLYLRTLPDLDASRRMETKQYFDGLGRAYRAATRENYDAAKPWLVADTEYDALGRVKRTSLPYRAAESDLLFSTGRWTQQAYDALGRVRAVTTRPDNAAVETAYDGDRVLVKDQAGKERVSRTDALGRLVEVWEVTPADPATDPAVVPLAPFHDHPEATYGYLTSYQYDALGNLRQVTQAAAGVTQTRAFVYDSLGRLTSATNPEGGTVSYTYDANGNLKTKTDARGVTATYEYDNLNRNTTVSYATAGTTAAQTPPVSRYYDRAGAPSANTLGRLWKTETGGVSLTAVDGYDAAGRPTSQTQKFSAGGAWGAPFTTSYAYDLAGNVTGMTYPSGHAVGYAYDGAGRLSAFSGNLGDGAQRSYASEVLYHELGGRTQERYGTQTPVYNKSFYNARGQLSEIRVSTYSLLAQGHETDWNRGAIINHYSHQSWAGSGTDNNGNLRKQDVYIPGAGDPTTQFYEYDALNRLDYVREVRGATELWRQDYDYDRWGNRTINQGGTSGGVPEPDFRVDAATNRLVAPPSQPSVMSYDFAGNLTNDTYTGAGQRWFDAENRMTGAQFSAGYLLNASYAYDADGRRVKRTTGGDETRQVYGMGGELLAEYEADSSPSAPRKEYGYRAGELLVAAELGGQQQQPQRTNFARASSNATATASSTLDSNRTALAAINGDRRGVHWGSDPSTGSGWHDSTADQYPDWIEVAFDGPKTIDEIDVFSVQDNYPSPSEPTEQMTFSLYGLSAFDVQYWTGSQWQIVQGGSVTGNNKVWKKLTFPAVTTTKIRVLVSGALASYSRVTEVEAWGTPAAAASYRAVADYSASQNPAGAWSYGYKTAGGSFTPSPSANTQFGAGLETWSQAGTCCPMVTKNFTGATVTYAGVIVQPTDLLNLHPGPSGQRSVVRWTAPSAGTYKITGRFQGLDTVGTTTDVAISHNRTNVFSNQLSTYGAEAPFSLTRTVAAGDTIEFSVGDGGNSYSNDSTGLAATLTPQGAAPPTVNWLVTDQLGTPRMVVDQTGSLAGVRRHDYLPFGEEIPAGVGGRATAQGYADDEVRHKFTGYERDDETALDYAQNRYYSSTQGRFTSVDPFWGSMRSHLPQSLNRYTYVLNNPLRYVDPLGLAPQDQKKEEEERRKALRDLGFDLDAEGRLTRADGSPGYQESVNVRATDPCRVCVAIGLGGTATSGIGAMGGAIVAGIKPIVDTLRDAAEKIRINGSRGRDFERQVLEALGVPPNNVKIILDGVGASIPDGLTDSQVIEIKDVQKLSLTRQFRIQLAYAEASRSEYVLVVNPLRLKTISTPLLNAIRAVSGEIRYYDSDTGTFTGYLLMKPARPNSVCPYAP